MRMLFEHPFNKNFTLYSVDNSILSCLVTGALDDIMGNLTIPMEQHALHISTEGSNEKVIILKKGKLKKIALLNSCYLLEYKILLLLSDI
jgi:hypothetical protein